MARPSAFRRSACLVSSLIMGLVVGASSVAHAEGSPAATYAKGETALLIVDPYNDFLSPGGKLYEPAKAVIESVGTVDHLHAVVAAVRRAANDPARGLPPSRRRCQRASYAPAPDVVEPGVGDRLRGTADEALGGQRGQRLVVPGAPPLQPVGHPITSASHSAKRSGVSAAMCIPRSASMEATLRS